MGLTGIYTGGTSIGGGYYRDEKGYVNKIGGGFVRTVDGQIKKIAPPYAQIPAGTILATVNKGLVSGGTDKPSYSKYMASNIVVLSKSINVAKDIPNGISIGFDPINAITCWDDFDLSADIGLSGIINKFSFVATYDELTSTNGYQLLGKSNYVDPSTGGWSDMYVKLVTPNQLQFYSTVYMSDGSVHAPTDNWQGTIILEPLMDLFTIVTKVEVK